MADAKTQLDKKFDEFLKKIKPMDDRILVQPLEEEMKSASGIVLPQTHKGERPQKGKVLAVGPGKMDEHGKRMALSVKAGDTILFSKYGPTEVNVHGKEVFFLEESSVLAVVNE